MRLIVLILCSIYCVALSNPLARSKRNLWSPWAQMGQAFAGAFASPFMPIPIPVPVMVNPTSSVSTTSDNSNSGSESSTSLSSHSMQSSYSYPSSSSWSSYPSSSSWSSNPSSSLSSSSFPNFSPFFNWPVFTFTFPQPWYKGKNVCVETRYAEEPDSFKDFTQGLNFGGNSNVKTESCKGTDTVYVCSGRTSSNEGSRQYMTKYQCCHGFIRASHGQPGCVESPNKSVAQTLDETHKINLNDNTHGTNLNDNTHGINLNDNTHGINLNDNSHGMNPNDNTYYTFVPLEKGPHKNKAQTSVESKESKLDSTTYYNFVPLEEGSSDVKSFPQGHSSVVVQQPQQQPQHPGSISEIVV